LVGKLFLKSSKPRSRKFEGHFAIYKSKTLLELNFLSFLGKKKEEHKTDKEVAVSMREFRRSFAIPRGVDVTKLKSKFQNGVLSIEAPKYSPPAAVSHERKIAIEHQK
jgi:HSP20 family molecular chaperone IbpA